MDSEREGSRELRGGCMMLRPEDIAWTLTFTLRKMGRHWSVLSRGVRYSNLLFAGNNFDCQSENTLREEESGH